MVKARGGISFCQVGASGKRRGERDDEKRGQMIALFFLMTRWGEEKKLGGQI